MSRSARRTRRKPEWENTVFTVREISPYRWAVDETDLPTNATREVSSKHRNYNEAEREARFLSKRRRQ